MTTARAFLRRLLSRSGAGAGRVGAGSASAAREPRVEDRLEAAQRRLKQEIPPPQEDTGPSAGGPPGKEIPPAS